MAESPHAILTGLGAAIRRHRVERRVSQEALSLETGVHRNYIGGIERAERSPTVVTVATLAAALDVPMSQLFREAEDASARD